VNDGGHANLVVAGPRTRRLTRVRQLYTTQGRVDQDLRTVALLVAVVEELGDDDAVLVGDVDARIGNSVQQRIAGSDALVQDSVLPDDLRIDVREQRIRDVLLLGELAKGLAIVVGDGVEPDSGGLEFPVGVAQLTELRPAGGSPDRRSKEDDDRLRAVAICVEAHRSSVGVGQLEVREPLAHLGAGRVSVDQAQSPRVAEGCRGVEAELVAFDGHAILRRLPRL
jgi:hypothetical protein